MRRHHVYPDATRLPLPGSHHGLGESERSVLTPLEQPGCELLRRSSRRSDRSLRLPGNLQHRPGESVHELRVHAGAQGRRHPDLDGREGPMDGQHLHRETLALGQVRVRLPERVRNGLTGSPGNRRLVRSLQLPTSPLLPGRQDADGGVSSESGGMITTPESTLTPPPICPINGVHLSEVMCERIAIR